MASAHGIAEVAHVDCPGGGQIRVEGTTAYVGHMAAPHGTSIWDVADPRRPRRLAAIDMPPNTHSHKVRAQDGVMLVNRERLGGPQPEGFRPGLGIWDVEDPANPRHVATWETWGKGVHRFDFDGRYAYISPTVEGYVGNITMILDLADPARPEEVGRWWIPGQWEAGGEDYPWADGPAPRCHHPLRMGDRLYTSYWHHGVFILGIEDMSKPRAVAGYPISPAYAHPQHTALPIPFPLRGRKVMLVADEDVAKLRPSPPALMWVFDVTDETRPIPISTFQVDGLDPDGAPQMPMTGCHQPCEIVTGPEIPVAWFAQGLRVVDVSDPYRPREAAHFLPDPPEGSDRVCANDVTVDSRGLIYLLDRARGFHVLERR